MNHFPVLLQRNLHAQCASQACACVLCAKLLQCCCPRTWPARVPGAMQRSMTCSVGRPTSTTHRWHWHKNRTHELEADKSISQPGCSHSNTIYDVQLQKTIVLRMQPRHRATLTQPLQCDLQRLSCKKYNKTTRKRCRKLPMKPAQPQQRAQAALQCLWCGQKALCCTPYKQKLHLARWAFFKPIQNKAPPV